MLWRYAIGVVAALLLPFAFWPSLLSRVPSSDFVAHRFCYLNNPQLIWTNVICDSVIAISYLAISATLALLVHRTRQQIPFSWVFLFFGLFIIACAGTHLMEAVTIWVPLYWLSADVKIVTALASLATAIVLPRLVPKTISLLSASRLATEQKLQLEAVNAQLVLLTQDATARLAAIVEGSEDAIIAYRLDGTITDWNQAATRLLGYSAAEAIGHNVSLLVPATRAGEVRELLADVAAGKRIQQFESVRQRKDGSLIDVSFSVAPILGQDGAIVGGSGIVRDITSRKQMEEELRRSEERFRLVALATRDAIADWDIASGAFWTSDRYWEQFGYAAMVPEPGLSAWSKLIHPDDVKRVWNGLNTAFARHADSYEVEHRLRRADGTYAIVLSRSYIAYGDTGAPTRAITTTTDLSDRRELEEQFRQSQKMEAVGRLAGGIAHDFNNILMVISTYAEMARDQLPPGDTLHRNLAEVLKASERAASLTHQLLAFSRKQVLAPRIIDLNNVIEESMKMIVRLIGEDIELNVFLAENPWAIKADPGQIVQVLMNLCVNARDAMSGGGELKIETRNDSVDLEAARKHPALLPGNYVTLVVSDKGSGMTQEVEDHIFDPFFTTKESGKGTGLGLSTVYGIVKQSGGYIWVESELGVGSSFAVYLPAVEAPLTQIDAPATSQTGGQGQTILLAEDEDALREAISAYLNVHGYTVLEAPDGAEALRLAKLHATPILVLITDVILPKKSGAELARELLALSPKLVTIFMSGYTDRNLVEYDPSSATIGFLQKPFELRTLLGKLSEMIAKQG
jgi:PAS domain S-box-containing protein